MPLEKPASVENDAFKSAKWDEITHARNFTSADAPVIALLCQWYKVIEQAQDELDGFGEQTAYTNALGDLKAFPQIATLKTASAEIRASATKAVQNLIQPPATCARMRKAAPVAHLFPHLKQLGHD